MPVATENDDSSISFFHMKVRGDEAIRSASKVIEQLIGSVIPSDVEPVNGEAVSAIKAPAATPAAIEHKPRKKPGPKPNVIPTYDRDPSEPDGFRAPAPKASTPVRANDFTKGSNKPKAVESFSKQPGALAQRIIDMLNQGQGVAPIDLLAQRLDVNVHAVAMSVGKCDRLKRMSNGRVALSTYEDED